MNKSLILLLLVGCILYSTADKLNRKIKNPRPMDAGNGRKYPGDIIESVHSNIPDAPQIKIRLADADEEDADADATISMDLESEDDDDDDDDLPIRKKKLPKSKTEDIHSFL